MLRIHHAVLACLALAGAPLAAQTPAHDSLGGSLAVGFVNTAGNTELTTLNVEEKLAYRPATSPWRGSQFFNIVYGKESGTENANLLKTGARVDYQLSKRLSAFAGGTFERNRFAGISRRFEEPVGLSFAAVQTDKQQLDLEGGLDFTQQRDLNNVNDNFTAARAAAKYQYSFTKNSNLSENLEFLPNLDTGKDYRINSETALVAPLSGRISVKLAYTIRFDNLPEPGFKKTDRIFTSGLQVTL